MRIYTQITQAEVSVLPEDHIDRATFAITVDYRGTLNGERQFAVLRGRRCLGTDGEWQMEPIPSERDNEWTATHRFDWHTALRLAAEHAPNIVINGHRAGDIARRLP